MRRRIVDPFAERGQPLYDATLAPLEGNIQDDHTETTEFARRSTENRNCSIAARGSILGHEFHARKAFSVDLRANSVCSV